MPKLIFSKFVIVFVILVLQKVGVVSLTNLPGHNGNLTSDMNLVLSFLKS